MIKKSSFLLSIYILLAILFWFSVGLFVLKGEVNFKFYSDSKVYEEIALRVNDASELIRFSGNEAGMVFLLKILGPENYSLIFLMNMLVFLLSIKIYFLNENIRRFKFLILIFLSPILFSSLFAINKEIFIFLDIALLLRYIYTRNKWWILCAILISVITRWQMTVFLILVPLILKYSKLFKNRRYLYFFLFLISISIVLFYIRNTILSGVFDKFERNMDKHSGGTGLFYVWMNIQDSYGYIFAFIPKVLHLLVGQMTRIAHVFNPDPKEMYNDIILFWQGPLNAYLIFSIFKRNLFDIRNDIIFIILIYIAIFGMTPIYNVRYFYAATTMLSYVLCLSPSKIYNLESKKY